MAPGKPDLLGIGHEVRPLERVRRIFVFCFLLGGWGLQNTFLVAKRLPWLSGTAPESDIQEWTPVFLGGSFRGGGHSGLRGRPVVERGPELGAVLI